MKSPTNEQLCKAVATFTTEREKWPGMSTIALLGK
jgi:hypothetical protein